MKEIDENDAVRVSRLLSGLTPIEAPEGFERGVRSRIADRRESDQLGRSVFWLALKFAAPLLLLALIGAFLVFSDDRSLNIGMVPPVELPKPEQLVKRDDVETPTSTASYPTNSQPEEPLTNRIVDRTPAKPESQERALSQDNTTMFPPGVDPRQAEPKNREPGPGGRITSTAILGMLGLGTSCSDAGCRVISVQANSIAEKAGLGEGDVVEAIDDHRIGTTTSFEGSVSVGSLRIVRAGKRLTIILSAH